jgi:ubiquinone/menaquinone biosynthesis C-methylase UbiE
MFFRNFSPAAMDARCQGRMLDRRIALVSDFLHSNTLPSSAHVLEIGAGTGQAMALVAQKHPQLNFHGIEPLEEYVKYANDHHSKNASSIKFSTGTAEHIDLPDTSMDCAYSVNVWHHIPHGNLLKAAQEINRVLKPGGAYFAIEPNWMNLYILIYQGFTPGERNFFPWRELKNINLAFRQKQTGHRFAFPEVLREIPPALQKAELILEKCPFLAGSTAFTFIKV